VFLKNPTLCRNFYPLIYLGLYRSKNPGETSGMYNKIYYQP
jgi:hypothetical protein